MKNEIVQYLSKFTDVSPALMQAIEAGDFIKHYSKSTLLLKEGQYSKKCFFVLSGCLRSYCLLEGEEKTVEFYTEEQAAIPTAYDKNLPSKYFLECVTDCVLGIGTPDQELDFYDRFPELERITKKMGENIFAQQQDQFAAFKLASPEQRYLNLLEHRPDLLQLAPQHQIASYLGIKPESLSRIRKRIKK